VTARLLLLPVDEAGGAALAEVARLAGYEVVLCAAGQDAGVVLAARSPHVLLVDAMRPLGAHVVTDARRAGAVVVYVSQSLDAYELATLARRRGALHFPRGGRPELLRRIVEDALATARAFRVRHTPASLPVREAAAASVARSNRLVAQSREVVDTARELRATRWLALAACRAGRDTLRQSVVACARELRDTGVPLERVLTIVRSALEASLAADAHSAPDLEEAATWCVEAYRAA
jgi:DNA-binding response OmpR family regulator